MALTCSECGYDNRDDALMCNLCGKIFRKEKKPAPETAPAPIQTAEASQTAQPPAGPRPESIDGLDAMGWYERGRSLLQQNQAAGAFECYEKALTIEPRFVNAWNNKATLLFMTGRNQDAYACLLTALAIDPLHATCWFTKAVIEHKTGQHARALRSLHEVLSFPGDLPQESVRQAQAVMQSLQKEGIQPAEREALGWAAEGTLRGRQGQFARALPCFEKAVSLDPRLAIAWHYQSCALAKLDRLEDALTCDDKALDLDASNPELCHQKGLNLKHLHRPEEALACYDRALELETRNPAYWSDRGLVLGVLDRHEDAVASLEEAIRLAPRAAPPWLNKALSEEAANRDEDAIESYKRFLELASPDLLSHIQHAKLRIETLTAELGAADSPRRADVAPGGGAASMFGVGAITGFADGGEKGENVEPNGSPRDRFEAAFALERSGRYEEAVDDLDIGLAAEPDRADAWYVRGCCLQQLGELDEAVASLERSIELEPGKAEVYYRKGVAEQLSGAAAEAARSLEKFLSLASPERHRALIEDARHRWKKMTPGSG